MVSTSSTDEPQSTDESRSTDTLPGALRAAAARWPDRHAVIDGATRLTFGDLLAHVRACAQGYLDHGLQPGDRVCLWAPNSWQWEVAALAVTYAGGTLVPLNTRYTGHEAVEIVARTRAQLVVVEDGFLGRDQVGELRAAAEDAGVRLPEVLTTDGLPPAIGAERVEADARADAVTPDDVADILFTSGTTGRSKGALSAHRQTVGVARIWGELGGVGAEDRYLVVNPFFHSFGYKVGIVTGLLTGATLFPMATFDVPGLMRIVAEERITVLPGAPTIYQSLLTAPDRASYDLSSLRLAVTGAAVVPVVLIERMREELEIDQVVTAFGMTECVVATMARADDPADLVASTCGRAVPGMETRIERPADAEPDAPGELLLRGPWVTLGYLDDPEATAAAIDADGWLHTGDVGTLDEAGNLRITDRLKDMYISGGFNVYPAEVEQALLRRPEIADVAVVGVPDERMGEVGRAYVVRSADEAGAALSAEDVVAFARERLANFKTPREVVFVDALPRNLSGKVLKTELRVLDPAASAPGPTEKGS